MRMLGLRAGAKSAAFFADPMREQTLQACHLLVKLAWPFCLASSLPSRPC